MEDFLEMMQHAADGEMNLYETLARANVYATAYFAYYQTISNLLAEGGPEKLRTHLPTTLEMLRGHILNELDSVKRAKLESLQDLAQWMLSRAVEAAKGIAGGKEQALEAGEQWKRRNAREVHEQEF